MRTILSSDAVEAAEAFGEILSRRMPEPRPELYEESFNDLWNSLEHDGWMSIAQGLPVDSSPQGIVLDLTAFAEVWGRHLIPLAFLESVATDLAATDGIDGVPFPVTASGQMLPTRGWHAPLPSADALAENDSFAPSLQIHAPVDAAGRSTYRHMFALWAAEAVGCAAAALERTVDYVKLREAYGRRIGTFQALQHILANNLRDVELARSGVVACALSDSGERNLALDVIDRSLSVITDAIQLHGGIGFTWELGLHLYLRHVLALRTLVEASQPETPMTS